MIIVEVPESFRQVALNEPIYYTICSYEFDGNSGNDQGLTPETELYNVPNNSSTQPYLKGLEVPSTSGPFSVELKPGHYLGFFFIAGDKSQTIAMQIPPQSQFSPNAPSKVTRFEPYTPQLKNGPPGVTVYPFQVHEFTILRELFDELFE